MNTGMTLMVRHLVTIALAALVALPVAAAPPAAHAVCTSTRRRRNRRCARRWPIRAVAGIGAESGPHRRRGVRSDGPRIIRPAATATMRCGGRARLSLDAFERFGEAARARRRPAAASPAGRGVSDQQAREAGAGSRWRQRAVGHRRSSASSRRRPTSRRPSGNGRPRRRRQRAATAFRRIRRARREPASAARRNVSRRRPHSLTQHPPHGAARCRPRHHRARRRGAVSRGAHCRARRGSSSICRRRAPGPPCSIGRFGSRRRRPGAAGSHRPASEQHHPGGARRGRRLELQRVSALQPVPPGDRLRAGAGSGGRHVCFTAIAAAPDAAGSRRRRRRDAAQQAVKPPLAARVVRAESSRMLPVSVAGGSAALDDAYVKALASRDVDSMRPLRLPLAVPSAATALAQARAVAAASTHRGRRRCAAAAGRRPPDPLPRRRRLRPAGSRWRVSSASASRASSSTRGTAATIRARPARASPKRSSCSTSRCGSRSCSKKSAGVEVVLTRRTDEFVAAAGTDGDRQPRRRRSVSLDSRQRQRQRSGARGRDLLPELRQQPERRGGGGARERRVGTGDGRAARFRQGDRAEQQARRVARLRHLVQRAMVERLKRAEQGGEGSRRQAGAVRRADRRGDAERAGGDLVPDQRRQEAKLLKSGAYRQRIADALFDAIRKYQTSLKTTRRRCGA